MRLILIRHGYTKANLEKRYIGRTDMPLCKEGIDRLTEGVQKGIYPDADIVYTSPMIRCLESADIIYPGCKKHIIEQFSEKDFGSWEMKDYEDLKEDLRYKAWVESNGKLPFPEGEPDEDVRARVLGAFDDLLDELFSTDEDPADAKDTVALIVHGGTIMTILSERLTEGKKGYYDYQCHCGGGYVILVEKDKEDSSYHIVKLEDISI